MKNFGPIARISFSLTCLTLGIVLTGDTLVGLSSGSLSAAAEYRKALSEALAVQYSHLAGRNHSDTIQVGLTLLIERNPQILSVAIQLASGGTFAQAGDHQRHWTQIDGGHSSIDHIQVPIFNGDARWGTLEIAFQPVAELENPWSFTHPWSRLILFVAFVGFISYLLFIKRTLRHLDPSAVIPARVKHALDVLAQGVVMLDQQGSIVLANSAFAKAVDLPLNDLIGSTLSQLAWASVTPSTKPSSEPWTMALNTRTAQTDERMVLADSSGKSRHFLVSSAPIIDESERLRGAVVSFDDVTQLEEANVALSSAVKELERSHSQIVTQNLELDRTNQSLVTEIDERKKAEAEREVLNRRLQEASRRIGMAEVATSVLHNVGNVLNSVNVSVGLIQKTLERTPVARLGRIGQMVQEHMNDLSAYLTQDEKGKQIPSYVIKLAEQMNTNFTGINKELDALEGNIDHIRSIIAAQQGHAKPQVLLEPTQLRDVVEQAVAINRDSLERAGIAVVREFAELPATMCDRHQVLQIMVNLINNAIYFMKVLPNRSHRLTLTISYHAERGERAQIQVQDTGIGINPDNFKRLFTQGFTTREGGQGLGLHSSFLAAKLLGGTVAAASEGEGKGATFVLDLPLMPVAWRPEESGEEEGMFKDTRKMSLENRRILVIDDNRTIHEDFRKILAIGAASDELDQAGAALFDEEPVAAPGESFDVDFAEQGEPGFRMVEQAVAAGQPYALAFVDMRMPPGWDGVETIEHIWQADREIQVVICTAFSDHPWHRIAARLGNPDRLLILRKPFDAIEVEQLAVSLAFKWELGRRATLQIDYLNGLVELRYRELQNANARLEQEVASRTAELTTRNAQLQLLNDELQGFVSQLRRAANSADSTRAA